MRAARLTLVTSLLAVLALGSLGATQATKSKAPRRAAAPRRPAIVRFDPRVFDIKFESIIAGFPNTDQPALQMGAVGVRPADRLRQPHQPHRPPRR
jgi:hypothetical protein